MYFFIIFFVNLTNKVFKKVVMQIFEVAVDGASSDAKKTVLHKNRVNNSIVGGALSYGQSSGLGVINKSIMAIQTSSEAS